ncbi:MAG TPA: hypothetical protein DDW76_18380 [Cyanobacteria bacterium UBA11369]|nr:hypothetical protein [Cyanobacteria bacterium UBA11368]HBE50682.1 hypothetical protein [Cyanobacteria bacterium UBA11369]
MLVKPPHISGCVRLNFASEIRREINPYAYWANDTQPQNLEIAPPVSEIKSIRALQEYNQRVDSRDFDPSSVRLGEVDDF